MTKLKLVVSFRLDRDMGKLLSVEYDPLRILYQSRLAKRLPNGKIGWNMEYFRQLILLGT